MIGTVLKIAKRWNKSAAIVHKKVFSFFFKRFDPQLANSAREKFAFTVCVVVSH